MIDTVSAVLGCNVNHTTICADSADALKQLPDNSVDMIATDPPYGIAFMSKN